MARTAIITRNSKLGGILLQEVTITVQHETGLHARPAARVVSLATRFKSALVMQKGNQTADLRSLIGLLSLGICHQDQITIRAEGKDESEAIHQLTRLLENLETD